MNHYLDKFCIWAIANKLTVNPNKSHAVIISPECNNNLNSCNDISLNCGKSKILINNCCKYLEILVDYSLNFAFHIKSMENKVAQSIGIISKLKHLLPIKTLLLLYYTIVHPYLLYGIQIWGNTYFTYLRNLIVLQNQVLHVIAGGKWDERVTQYYIKFHILKLSNMYTYEIAKLMHKYCNNRLRNNSNDYFSRVSSVNSKGTRLLKPKLTPNIPRFQLSKYQRLIIYKGAKIWNAILNHIKSF